MANYQYRNREEKNLQNDRRTNAQKNRQLKVASSSVKTKSPIVKKKLLVYRNNGKTYIDHSAAYALGLTNVRAIMIGKPHLIECDSDFLNKMQNDRSIEVEYSDTNELQEGVEMPQSDLSQELDTLENGEYGIGVHSIVQGNAEEKINIATSICNEGLIINNNSKTILSTAISIGTNDGQNDLGTEAIEYNYGSGPKTLAIIAVPLCIQNESGEKIFLGFPEKNKSTSAQQYEEHCILDRVCGKLKKVPPEFILGYYCENGDSSTFVENPTHYSKGSTEQREEVYNEVFQSMDEFSKSINSLIASGNIDALMQMQEKMQILRMPTYIIDNAIELSQHYIEKEISSNTNTHEESDLDSSAELHTNVEDESEKNSDDTNSIQRRSTRRIILNDAHLKEVPLNEEKAPNAKRIRKILIDSYTDITTSDLANGKGILKSGKEEIQLQQEGNGTSYGEEDEGPSQE